MKCPIYEMSYLLNVLSMKCPIYEMSCLWNVLAIKSPIYEMSYLWDVLPIKSPIFEKLYLKNVLSMKCPIYECPCHSINCPNKTLKVDDQFLIPQFKLSQQSMITTGYRRGIKSIHKSAILDSQYKSFNLWFYWNFFNKNRTLEETS